MYFTTTPSTPRKVFHMKLITPLLCAALLLLPCRGAGGFHVALGGGK